MTATIATLADAVLAGLAAEEKLAQDLLAWADGTGRADGGAYEFHKLVGDPLFGPFGGQSPIRNWGTGQDIAKLADPHATLDRIARTRQHVGLLLAEKHHVADDQYYTCPAATQERDGGTYAETSGGGACTCDQDERVRAYLTLLLPTTTET